jgi:DNA helicase-2/ATP-dependent DNA helicase PcrA
MDFLAGLNPPQREAVAHVRGPLLILAGAGSGKTRVITHRIGHLIQDHAVTPESILAVTFTNKAAAEMRERIARLLGGLPPGRGPNLFTFHSFCVRLLRRDGAPLAAFRPSFTRQFLIYDDDDQLALLKSLYRQHNIDDKALPPRNVLSTISSAKNKGEGPAEISRQSRDPKAKNIAALYEQYTDALIRANAFDFDDLLLETVRLLKHDPDTREMWNRRIEFLMVDEYQDTNRVQYELMRLLCRTHDNVCAVGDEDQSIYSWRGADIRNILDFERDFPAAISIRLEQNYRSTKNILEAASAVIANNTERKGKWLWTESAAGPKVTLYTAYNSEGEALYIADAIEKALRLDPSLRAAVLYRTNAQSRQIEEALRRYRTPYIVVGGLSFYQRAEIKDMLAYLKVLLVPQDSVSLLRIINVPARGIGKTTIEHLEKYAGDHKLHLWDAMCASLDGNLLSGRAAVAVAAFRSLIEEIREKAAVVKLHELLATILERVAYREMVKEDRNANVEAKLENLDELLNAAAEASDRGEGVAEFLDHAALVSDADQVDSQARVSLLTIHNAKGLEFPLVFLAGMEEGLFPHSRSADNEAALEEERRLCYVGMTRAEQRLTVSWAQSRRRYGGSPEEPAMPSRFLKEIPKQLCELAGAAKSLNDAGFESPGEVDLFAERHYVRESVKWTSEQIRQSHQRQREPGKSYNSEENVADFFQNRGSPATGPIKGMGAPPARPPARTPFGGQKKKSLEGATVSHSKYGRGTVVRKEGDGEDAKLTVLFPGVGLKKLIAKFAGLKVDE